MLQGFCICYTNYTVNGNYSATDNKTKYCVEKASEERQAYSTVSSPTKAVTSPTISTSPTKLATKTTSKSDPTIESQTTKPELTNAKNAEPDKNEVKIDPVPSHHLLGGILLPIMIVLAFISAVFAIRKYSLIDRAHGYIRGRNQATRYNGLMENDFDDDPLLI